MGKSKIKKVRAGVIGVGIGQCHIQGYKQAANAEMVAICDINEERAAKVSKEFGVPEIYYDYKEMLKKADIDTVSVCTPNLLHSPMAIDCLKAGKNVLCEKPMTMNAKEAEKLAAEVAKTKSVFMVGYTMRYMTEGRALRKMVEADAFGQIYYAKAMYLRRRGIPGMGGWFTTKKESGGGPLIDLGVHVLDLVVWLMGKPKPVSAYGTTFAKFGPFGKGQGDWGLTKKQSGTFDVEDMACGMVKFDNGAMACVEVSWASQIKKDIAGCQLFGTKGGATTHPLEVFTDLQGMPTDLAPTPQPMGGHVDEVAHFVDCIVEGKPCEAPVEDGVAIMKMLDAIYQSAATGKEVIIK